MSTKFSQEEKKLYEKIDEILYNEWNPIGFGDLPRDEYSSCVPEIYKLKKASASIETIAQTLFRIETTHMGLPGNMEKCWLIGTIIVKL
jgi:hypothetical protein